MATLAGEKRKNDEQIERRRLPWWLLLLVGFALGIIFTLSVSMGRSGTTTVYSPPIPPDALLFEATHLIIQATLTAQAPLLQAQAAQNHQIASEFDPFAATATAIIQQATQQASNP